MTDLKETNPQMFNEFEDGNFVIRRLDRFWAGLSPDLVIEQVLMRFLKTAGGMTRRDSMRELQRLTWLLSAPVRAAISSALQEITGVTFETSEQHKDAGVTRFERDFKDVEKVVHLLLDFSPFTKKPFLRNIVTGEIASEQVDVDEAIPIGRKILNDMKGKDTNIYNLQEERNFYYYESAK